MARQPDPNSIRSLGHTVIHVDAQTKAKLKKAAGEATLIDYLRDVAERDTGGDSQGELLPTLNTISSVKRDTASIMSALKVIWDAMSTGGKITPEQQAIMDNSVLSFMTDKAIVDSAKSALKNTPEIQPFPGMEMKGNLENG